MERQISRDVLAVRPFDFGREPCRGGNRNGESKIRQVFAAVARTPVDKHNSEPTPRRGSCRTGRTAPTRTAVLWGMGEPDGCGMDRDNRADGVGRTGRGRRRYTGRPRTVAATLGRIPDPVTAAGTRG